MSTKKPAIKNFFSAVKFTDKGHQYKIGYKSLNKSVSGVVKNYVPKVDFKQIAKAIDKRDGLKPGTTSKAWKENADKACDQGTKVHLFGEKYMFDRTLKPSNGFEEAIVNFWDTIPPWIIPVFSELVMYHKKFKYGGTADIILYDIRRDRYIIADYKGLPLDTKIMTSKGWSTMGEVKKGDIVFDKDGLPCKIKATSSIKNKKCYKITFDNNEEIISDFEHRWEVSFKIKDVIKDVVMTTEEMKEYIENSPKDSCKQMKIYNPKPLQNEEKELPIDPYLLGVWLGDGHSRNTKITQMNPKVWEELEKRGYKLGPDISGGSSGKAQTRTVYNMIKIFRNEGLLGNKHIPVKYLLSSENQRLDLLRGFMDADGYYNKTRKRYVMATTRRSQVDFFLPLLGSLGIKPTVIEAKKYCNDKVIPGWDVVFTTQINPFLNRNQDINLITNAQHKYRRITKIEEVESVPTRCIEVDSPSHTFLYGETFIKTHNTNKDLFKNFKEKKLLPPFETLLDNDFNKYQIQLSLYQILFEQTGYKVSERIIVWLKPDGECIMYDAEDLTDKLEEAC